MRHLDPTLKRDLGRALDTLGRELRDLRDGLLRDLPSREVGTSSPVHEAPLALRSRPTFRPAGFETKDRGLDGPTFNGTANCRGHRRIAERGRAA